MWGGCSSSMTIVLIKKGYLDKSGHRHTCRENACEDEGGDQVMLPQAKGYQRSPTNHQTLGEKHGRDLRHVPYKKLALLTP